MGRRCSYEPPARVPGKGSMERGGGGGEGPLEGPVVKKRPALPPSWSEKKGSNKECPHEWLLSVLEERVIAGFE